MNAGYAALGTTAGRRAGCTRCAGALIVRAGMEGLGGQERGIGEQLEVERRTENG